MGNIKVGLEIHGYLNTKKKLFCNCPATLVDIPNVNICPICTGQPGAKPMLPNKEALEKVIQIALILNSKVNLKTNFQRKHYNWPDSPNNYQRTMSGSYAIHTADGGEFKGIRISELHLEEDPAAWDPETGKVNYNRAGFPLVEIVTEPDFRTPEQIRTWLKELILYASYINAFNPNLNIKSDVNVSIEESGFQRVEIKNVNSFTNIVRAVEVEVERQREIVAKGGKIEQETRRFNEALDTTEFMRSKEDAQDYMFIPEPDLPNVVITKDFIDKARAEIPELPDEKRKRYEKYGFDRETIEVLISNLYLTSIFENAVNKGLNAKDVGLFLRREVLRVLHYNKATFRDLEDKNIKDKIVKLVELLGSDKISYNTAQEIIEKLWENSFDVKEYVEKNNLVQVQDESLIKNLVVEALKKAPKAVEDYKNGNTKALNFIIGIVMRETKGTAKPQLVNKILQKEVKKL